MKTKNRAYLLIGLFCFITSSIFGQDQRKADSLISVFNSGDYDESELDLLADILGYESDPEKKIEFADLLINKAAKDSSFVFLHYAYMQKGNAFAVQGNNPAALKAYFEAIRIGISTGPVVAGVVGSKKNRL